MAEEGAFEGENEFKLYRYDPNLAGNILFVVLFVAVTIWHVIILVRKRTWYFVPFVIGCACKLPLTSLIAPSLLRMELLP